ncbi:outer membrane protein OmpA-like peptidoglycan-associated protein [Pseudaminobacter salicylatoxidans]|uniref:Outer membrane protein OmpA-like peptidoglycan-associated protein n=1 Tax=Pseudaminobacter salicylatoxidans TaxID=93369 RepID=A0A316C130_PSESE|nr:OmpA family protein [Pseudaminobacter salicylatoxidans]PWJ80568.1 outer membrane protein OmpA-like peptidoglycan-associated protein [Pseudaminobacter salicylatoxidans]
MKRQPRILTGTALGLLMASAPLSAAPMPGNVTGEAVQAPFTTHLSAPIVLAQAEEQPLEEVLPKKHRKKEQAPAEAAPEAAPQAQEAAPAEEQPMKPRRKERKEAPAAGQEMAPVPAEARPEAAPEKPRKKNRKETPAAEQEMAPAPAEAQPEAMPEKPRKKNRKETPAAEQEMAPAPAEAQPEAMPEKPRKKNRKETPAAEQEMAPAPAEAQPEAAPEKPRKKNRKEAPATEQETAPVPAEKPTETKKTPQEATPEQPTEAKPEKRVKRKGGQQAPETEQPGAPSEATTPTPAEKPVTGEEQQAPAETTGEGKAVPTPDSQKAAPVPDSQKLAPAEGQAEGTPDQGKRGQRGEKRRPAAPEEAGPPPADDKAAQREVRTEKIEPVTAEQGKRVKERRVDISRRERPEGTEVLKQFGDRVIIELGKQIMVESDDRPRMRHGARDVYYEDLSRGRTRETIERGDGTRVVTIRNSYGDVIRRSRITPDGREYVLVYVEDEDLDRVRDWRDPGLDLPPLRLDIPEDEYVLTAERARDPDMYYRFLEQPPVEPVERLYSIDEVKRSARIRDKTRRIDLDTITFDFGSASIAENEIQRLEGVATAIERILERNPAETFLIEGHTDAVGSDLANLALSDKRAESVADALTNVFDIPPENLATQGYGEQFLKVGTDAPERQNRRVVIRRITPLVAPVASNGG